MDINVILRVIWLVGLGFTISSVIGVYLLNHVKVRDPMYTPRLMSNIIFLITGLMDMGTIGWMFMWITITALVATSACLIMSSIGMLATPVLFIVFVLYVYGRYKALQIDP